MVDKAKCIWMDGKFVPWAEAQVHVLTHTLHYGLGAFEGIRCYELAAGGSGVFRLREHIQRLVDSCKITMMTCPYSVDELVKACVQTVRENGFESCYLRPLVVIGEGAMGVYATDNPVRSIIAAWRWGAYLGKEGLEKGIRVRFSSFVRSHPNAIMAKGKVCGHYVNSVMAKREAIKDGYDESVLLTPAGHVAEASGENVFLVKDGRVVTPPPTDVLAGITRDSVITICKAEGIEVVERLVARDELYIADEIFLTGTAAEITPVREVEGRQVTSSPGPVTRRLQGLYFKAVRRELPGYERWVTLV